MTLPEFTSIRLFHVAELMERAPEESFCDRARRTSGQGPPAASRRPARCEKSHLRAVPGSRHSALRRTKAADRNMRKGVTEASIESDGIDVFVVYNGARIAKRTDPNNPQACIWASLEPGYRVFYKDYPAKLIVECDDKIISSKTAFIDA